MDFLKTTLLRLPFTATFRKSACVVFGFEASIGVLACMQPLVQRRMVDAATAMEPRRVVTSAAIVAALTLASFAFSMANRWQRGKYRSMAIRTLKGATFRCLLALPESYLKERGTGYFFNRVQLDVGETVNFICDSGVMLWVDAFKFLIALGMVLWLNWKAGVLAVLFVIPQALICYHFRRKQSELSVRLHENTAQQRQMMQEYLDNHTVLRTHDVVGDADAKIQNGLSDWSGIFLKRVSNANFFALSMQLPSWICLGGMTLGGLYWVACGKLTLGMLWAILELVRIVFAPAKGLALMLIPVASAIAAWQRIRELVEQTHPDEEDGGIREVPKGDIVFEDVKFGYQPGQQIVNGLSLCLKPGKLVFLTGPNGCGKSTALALLLKLYSPQSGRITVGGVPLDSINTTAWRRRIGFMGQTPAFVRGTLRENLLLGNHREISDEQMREALAAVGADRMLANHKDALDAAVSQDGDNFSGGERLRLALARELLRDTDVLLLDEPAANLDVDGKAQFCQLLQHLAGRRTILAVMHGVPDGFKADVCQM